MMGKSGLRPRRSAKRREFHDLPRGLQLVYSEAQGWRDQEAARCPEVPEAKFKALKSSSNSSGEAARLLEVSSHNYGGFQAGEKSQMPPKLFPGSLASYVLVFQTDGEWHDADLYPRKGEGAPISYAKLTMQPLVDKLRSADMIVREMYSSPKLDAENELPYMFALVSIGEKRQCSVAEIMSEHKLMRVRMRKMDDIGNEIKNGGAWTYFKQHLMPYFEKSSEGTLFSSAQQIEMIEFVMKEVDERAMGPQMMQKEACEPGNSVLQQLVEEQRIVAYYPLHHRAKRQWLSDNWCNSYFSRQPVEDVREYFGEEIALFFLWFGYLCTMLWIPAGVGLFVFAMQMTALSESGSVDNPYNPLYAIFLALWGITWSGGFKRLELVYQHEWDTIDYEAPKPDRRDFLQNPSTYKMLNKVSKKEEYYPDPLYRVGSLIASSVTVSLLILVNMVLVLVVEVLIKMLGETIGLPALAFMLGANVQGLLIIGFRWLAEIVFRKLNDMENWKSDSQYQAAFISKLFAFGMINSYFALFFAAFIANDWVWLGLWDFDLSCPDRRCIDYVTLMIMVIFVQGQIIRFIPLVLPMCSRMFSSEPTVEEEEGKVDAKCKCPKCTPRLLNDDEKAAEEGFSLPSFREELTKEADKPDNGGGPPQTLDDCYFYNLMELGYLLFFGAACPQLPLLLLITNLIELRLTASQFLFAIQRPRYRTAKDIGDWQTIIDIMVIVGILAQSGYLAFVSDGLYYYFPYQTLVDKTFMAVIIEHLLLLFKVMYDQATGRVPDDVDIAYQVKNHELSISLEHFDTKEADNVKFFTDDEGFPYYGN